MSDTMYPVPGPELAKRRRELVPESYQAFRAFSKQVFEDGAIPARTKQLIAVAVAHVTQCPYCITGHTKQAIKQGASDEEIMEAIWVAAEMRAGAAFAHMNLSLGAMAEARGQAPTS
jgi:AhpD family alkylhydroperoxidase